MIDFFALCKGKTMKLWITPENETVFLDGWHYQYFRDEAISQRYGVPFGKEIPTRLAALRVGFVRVNYERNGGRLTLESMRFDRPLRKLVDEMVIFNRRYIDLARMTIVDGEGQAIQHGAVSLHQLREHNRPIDRMTLGSWNNFLKIEAPGALGSQ